MEVGTVHKINSIRSLIIFSFALIFGVFFLIIAIKINQQKIPENYIEIQATIARIDEEIAPGYDPDDDESEAGKYEYHVFVDYSYGGKSYEAKEYGQYDSSMKEGDTVLLYLDPDNPAEFMSDPSGNFIYVIIGIVIILIGAGGVGYYIYKRKKR